jgi:hypothetical protein
LASAHLPDECQGQPAFLELKLEIWGAPQAAGNLDHSFADRIELAGMLIDDLPHNMSLADLIETVGERFEGSLSNGACQVTLNAFVNANVFVRAPVGKRLLNQTLTLRESIRTIESLLLALRNAVELKLRNALGSADKVVLDAMFDGGSPENSSP